MMNCNQCPHVVGDAHERDCSFPDCIGWTITHNPKSIPDRRFDWDFYHKDYDGCDGGNGLSGEASSYKNAIEQIIDNQKRQ